MDQFKGAFNSFTGGNSQNQQHYQQPQGAGQQQRPGGTGGFDMKSAFNSFTGGHNQNQQHGQQPQAMGSNQQANDGGNFFGGLTDKFNNAAGGGRESEKNEDYLDKGVDFVQEKFLGQGPQDNESAIEQAKDEQISDFIRDKYKSATGKDFFIKDKQTKF